MSQTSKIVLGIAVVAVILLGAFYYWHTTQQTQATPEHPEVTTLPTSASDTSDAAIDQDLQAVDAQLGEVQSDNADASASVNTAVTAQ